MPTLLWLFETNELSSGTGYLSCCCLLQKPPYQSNYSNLASRDAPVTDMAENSANPKGGYRKLKKPDDPASRISGASLIVSPIYYRCLRIPDPLWQDPSTTSKLTGSRSGSEIKPATSTRCGKLFKKAIL
jgi:hypothetical protein